MPRGVRAKFTLEFYKVIENSEAMWRWRVRARNGKIIANGGESFHRKTACRASAISLVFEATEQNTKVVEVHEVEPEIKVRIRRDS